LSLNIDKLRRVFSLHRCWHRCSQRRTINKKAAPTEMEWAALHSLIVLAALPASHDNA
jgi:hypothetical protein